MRYLSFALTLGSLAATVSATNTGCTDGWDILQTYDIFTVGDLWSSSDVEGKTFIGGGLVSSNSANFGIHLQSTTQPSFEIAGSITSGNSVNINKGSVTHSSSITSFLQNPAVQVCFYLTQYCSCDVKTTETQPSA